MKEFLLIILIALTISLGSCSTATYDLPSADKRYAEAVAFLKNNQINESLNAVNEVLAMAPEHLGGSYLRTLALAFLGRYDEALVQADTMIKVHPDTPISYLAKGLVYMFLPDKEKASLWMQKACDMGFKDICEMPGTLLLLSNTELERVRSTLIAMIIDGIDGNEKEKVNESPLFQNHGKNNEIPDKFKLDLDQ